MRAADTRTAATLGALVTMLVLTSPAQAAFPAANGKIAFQSNRDGQFEIYAMNNDGTGQTRLTNNAASDASPAWSPDGTKIAFTSNRDGNNEIYTMNANGTGPTRLTNNAVNDVTATWSRTGAKIVFATNRDGNSEIYTMNADGTSPTRLTNNAALDGQPVWSPNGTPNTSLPNTDKIAFISNRDGNFEIYTMNGNGTGQANQTFNAADDMEPSWSPNGVDIAWQRPVGGDSELFYGISTNDLTSNTAEDVEPAVAPANPELSHSDVVFSTNRNGNFEIYKCITPKLAVPACNAGFLGPTRLTNNAAADSAPDWQPAVRSYPRPKSASQIKIPLVPAHKECAVSGASNTQHEGSLLRNSCNPPNPEASYLTVGTPDLNGAAANAVGIFKLTAFCNGGAVGEAPPCLTTPGDQLDGLITISQTDVRCQGSGPNCAGGPLSDYAGVLRVELVFRVTDKNSGGANGAATFDPGALFGNTSFNVPCATNGDPSVGSTCSVTTTIDTLHSGSTAITEQKRAIWELRGPVELFDPGPDGNIATSFNNGLFVIGGVFFP